MITVAKSSRSLYKYRVDVEMRPPRGARAIIPPQLVTRNWGGGSHVDEHLWLELQPVRGASMPLCGLVITPRHWKGRKVLFLFVQVTRKRQIKQIKLCVTCSGSE